MMTSHWYSVFAIVSSHIIYCRYATVRFLFRFDDHPAKLLVRVDLPLFLDLLKRNRSAKERICGAGQHRNWELSFLCEGPTATSGAGVLGVYSWLVASYCMVAETPSSAGSFSSKTLIFRLSLVSSMELAGSTVVIGKN